MKILSYLRFDLELCKQHALRINPNLRMLETSICSQMGLDDWLDYLRGKLCQTTVD